MKPGLVGFEAGSGVVNVLVGAHSGESHIKKHKPPTLDKMSIKII